MAKRKAMLVNTGDTTLDKIWAHYKNPKQYALTELQEQVKERWLTAWKLLAKKKYKSKVARVLCDMYGVSTAQAFRDIRNAEALLGKALKADRDGQLALLYQFALEGFKKAMNAGDYKTAKGFHDAMRDCVPKETDINFNPEKLENKPVKMSINKEVGNAILNHLLTGSLDFNNLTVDTDFEELEGNGED